MHNTGQWTLKPWNLNWTLLAGLAPLVGAGWLEPWWVCWMYVLLGVYFVHSRLEHMHLQGSLPVVLALFPAALLYPDPLRMSAAFLVVALSGLLLIRATHTLMKGSLPALIVLALVWAAFPSALGLLGLLCAALARSEQQELQHRDARVPVLLGGVALVLLPVAALLPPPPTQTLVQHLNVRIQQPDDFDVPAGTLSETGLKQWVQKHSRPSAPSGSTSQPSAGITATAQWTLFTVLLLFAAVLLLARERIRVQHPRWSDLVLMLAVLSVLLAVLVYSQLHANQPGEGETLQQTQDGQQLSPSAEDQPRAENPEQSGQPDQPEQPDPGNPNIPWWPFVVSIGLAAWFFRKTYYRKPAATSEKTSNQTLQTAPAVTLQGVRRLYRDFLQLMEQHGVGRTASDTPDEFAAQLQTTHPHLQVWVSLITSAYLPVRYGNLPDQDTFEQAREALQHLQEALQKGQK